MPKHKVSQVENSVDSENNVQTKPKKRRTVPKDSEVYRDRRDKNNVAVKKSREKSKIKAMDTMEKVKRLRNENEELEQQVEILSKELGVLKDLFKMVHSGDGICAVTGEAALEDIISDSQTGASSVKEENDSEDSNTPDQLDTIVNTEALRKDHEYFAKP